jgi:hypothetical protein
MLTIVAQNSSLGDILHEVHRRTGATIDFPPTATERVVTRIGPGPAREVLVTLLNGAGYNYVMMGTASDSTALASVILTSKPAVSTGGAPVTTAYQPPTQYMGQQPMAPGMGPGGPVVQPTPADEEADAEETKDEEDTADQEQAQDQTGNAATAQDGSQPNSGPKTPEQILEMLRQRQQQPPQPGQIVPPPQFPQPNAQPPDTQ